MTSYRSILFERPKAFPGVPQNQPSFDSDDGFIITREGDTVRVTRGTDAIEAPWSAVAQASPSMSSAPDYAPPPTMREATPPEPAPAVTVPERKGRRRG